MIGCREAEEEDEGEGEGERKKRKEKTMSSTRSFNNQILSKRSDETNDYV